MYKFLCGHTFSVLLATNLRVELLGHMITMFNMVRNFQTISTAAAPYHNPTRNVWMLQVFHIPSDTCYCLHFYYSHPSAYKVYKVLHTFDLYFLHD